MWGLYNMGGYEKGECKGTRKVTPSYQLKTSTSWKFFALPQQEPSQGKNEELDHGSSCKP